MMAGGYRPNTKPAHEQVASMLDLSKHCSVACRSDGSPWVRTIPRYSTSYSTNDIVTWELGDRVARETDKYDDIDKRLARAVPTDMLFADYIGAD